LKSISNAVVFEQTGVSSKRVVAIPFYLIVSNNLCLKSIVPATVRGNSGGQMIQIACVAVEP
jgi:hypothetical protein